MGLCKKHHNCWMRCCIFSFTVWYASIIVRSLMTMSVGSFLGLLTRDAMVVESVSTIILYIIKHGQAMQDVKLGFNSPIVDSFIQTKNDEVVVLQNRSFLYLIF